ncbi:type II toxin-antitoxin system RelE family toxin [Photobacterium damselae]|uniref:type II toxin-antitoxin system RelE family toxin n=1 Tax=Photobacterium damselae TaxID=38293 RepID=UPI001F431FCC|nr:type II toxin-antitoxin system RelE/ParE family toxin [Photobacterium damselae]UKA12898.1 type II toxin-antitoxin system RelE/ParE family toxin [Photobacterium damselae subsp. damselae]
MNKIEWSKTSLKQLRKIPNSKLIVKKVVDELKDFSDSRNVKRLTNHKYDYRLRVGNYRVLFDHDDIFKIIDIQEVKKRDERTY